MIQILLLSLITLFTNNVFITGHLTSEKRPVSGKMLLLKTGSKTIAYATTEQDGSYNMTFLDTYSAENSFKFYLVGKSKQDIMLLKTVETFENDTPVVDLVIPSKN